MKQEFFYLVDEEVTGPVSLEELLIFVGEGRFQREDLVYHESEKEWKTLEEYLEPEIAIPESIEKGWVLLRVQFGVEKAKPEGPMQAEDIQEMLKRGEVRYHDYVWKKGMESWKTIADLPELHIETTIKKLLPIPEDPKEVVLVGNDSLGVSEEILGSVELEEIEVSQAEDEVPEEAEGGDLTSLPKSQNNTATLDMDSLEKYDTISLENSVPLHKTEQQNEDFDPDEAETALLKNDTDTVSEVIEDSRLIEGKDLFNEPKLKYEDASKLLKREERKSRKKYSKGVGLEGLFGMAFVLLVLGASTYLAFNDSILEKYKSERSKMDAKPQKPPIAEVRKLPPPAPKPEPPVIKKELVKQPEPKPTPVAKHVKAIAKKVIPAPRKPPSYLKLKFKGMASKKATIRVITDASHHFPVTFVVLAKGNQVTGQGRHVYSRSHFFREKGSKQVPAEKIFSLGSGWYEVRATLGEQEATKKIFFGKKNGKFWQDLKAKKKLVAISHQWEKEALYGMLKSLQEHLEGGRRSLKGQLKSSALLSKQSVIRQRAYGRWLGTMPGKSLTQRFQGKIWPQHWEKVHFLFAESYRLEEALRASSPKGYSNKFQQISSRVAKLLNKTNGLSL